VRRRHVGRRRRDRARDAVEATVDTLEVVEAVSAVAQALGLVVRVLTFPFRLLARVFSIFD
jgi:hypothetical protein